MNFLKKEYPKYNAENIAWKNALFTAAAVLLIFLLLQPFGFRSKAIALKLILYPGYTLLAFFYYLTVFFVVRYFHKKKQTWSLKNEIITRVIGVAILTIIIHLFTWIVVDDMPLTLDWYFKLFYHTFSLFLLIAVIEYFYYNSHSASKKINESHESEAERLMPEIIVINLEKEQIEINRSKIVFIQSIGNYLEFCIHEANGAVNRVSKRGRLHQVEKDLISCAEFYRCHRAFIVNMKHVFQLRGNIKNARIIFEGEKQQIPVSRSNYKNLKNLLEKNLLGWFSNLSHFKAICPWN